MLANHDAGKPYNVGWRDCDAFWSRMRELHIIDWARHEAAHGRVKD